MIDLDNVRREAIEIALELARRKTANKLARFYPDEDRPGYPARHRYKKHLEFFRRGRDIFARCFMAAMGSGKTEGGALYEWSYHLRGEYPWWWEGHRFNRPIDIWAAGKTLETTRDILQTKWLGMPHNEGTGILPEEWLDKSSIVRVANGGISRFAVIRADGTRSWVGFKSYEKGVSSFFGTEKDGILLDEPAPLAIFSQCAARTRTRPDARITFTVAPIEGNTEAVRHFLENRDNPELLTLTLSWEDTPHLTEYDKRKILASYPAYLHEAITSGLPIRSGSAVYPIPESTFVIDPIPFDQIPTHWRWVVGMDCGLHNTAVGWYVWDPDRDIIYLVSDYKAGGIDPDSGQFINAAQHATVIKVRGKMLSGLDSIPVVADAAAASQDDGRKLIDIYRAAGLDIELPDKAVFAGITATSKRFAEGTFKVSKACVKWLDEFRNYSLDENDKPIKVNDHLMDQTRYILNGGYKRAKSRLQTQRGNAQQKKVGFG